LLYYYKLLIKERSTPSTKQQGSPSLGETVDLWRAGKAGDTITVVIYSKLPVVCLVNRFTHRVHARMLRKHLNCKITAFSRDTQVCCHQKGTNVRPEETANTTPTKNK
jgi:hypothetical protein